MTDTAPIAIFVFNRPDHARETVESLAKNRGAGESDLFVFSDAARDGQSEPGVADVRAYIRTIRGFRAVTLIERESNYGLARSIIDGVSRLCRERGRAIVLEDDIVTSPWFLSFMNAGLDRYHDDERVAGIVGYLPAVDAESPLPESFFCTTMSSWGWATWQRAWQWFEPDAAILVQQLRASGRTREFNVGGSMDFSGMLERQARGELQSWAIRWYASMFLRGMLSLHPGRSLVRNIGHDGSGVHCEATSGYDVAIYEKRITQFPDAVVPYQPGLEALVQFYTTLRRPLPVRIAHALRRVGRSIVSRR